MPDQPAPGETLPDPRLVRRVVLFGIPLVVGMGFHALFNLVDLWIVGKLGTEALAAVTIATMINTVPMVICNGISTSSIAFIARHIGFRNLHRANDVMKQSFLLVILLSVILGVIPWIYARDLVVALKAEGGVIEPAADYLAIVSAGTITMFLLMQITAVLRAVGDGLWPMILLVGANLLNIGLDFGLVFGLWGLPRLNAPGAAWATVISRAVFCGLGLWLLFRGKGGLRLTWAPLRLKLRTMWGLVRVGTPSSAQWVVRLVAYLAILWIVGDAAVGDPFGKTAQAAFGVGLRLDLFAIFAGFGWGAAASTLVGQNLGRRRPDLAERYTWVAAWLNLAMMSAIAVAYFVFAAPLVRFFGADAEMAGAAGDPNGFAEVVAAGSEYLRIIVISYPFVAVSLVFAQALNGAGSTRTPMLIDAAGLLLFQVPLAYHLSRRADFGLAGVWWAIVVSNVAMAGVYFLLFRVGRWKKKELW